MKLFSSIGNVAHYYRDGYLCAKYFTLHSHYLFQITINSGKRRSYDAYDAVSDLLFNIFLFQKEINKSLKILLDHFFSLAT